VHGLEQLGHSVEVVDLPSHGRDGTPKTDVTLDLYAEALAAVAQSKPEPPVLVGHSMAGLVITQAAENVLAAGGQIAGLIYVAAVLPRDGKAQNDYTTLPEGEGDGLRGALTLSDTSPRIATLNPEIGAATIFADLDQGQAELFALNFEPQTVRVLFTPIHIEDDRPIPRGYILCTRDRAIPTALQRRVVAETPGVRVVELDSDHSPFLSHPDDFVSALDELLDDTTAVATNGS
jgi:pimeloyl-ACP methyl ester carboxylesterase